jgi:hypothetical protein
MSPMVRLALVLVVVSSGVTQARPCVYSARGRVYAEDGKVYRYRVNAAPCPEASPPGDAPPPEGYPPPLAAEPPPPPVVVMPAPPPPPPPPPPARNIPLIAIKYGPGMAASVAWGSDVTAGVGFSHSVGLEVRPWRWAALRSDFEWRPDGRAWDFVGLKLWVFPPSWFLRPYLSGSVSAAELYASRGHYQMGVTGAAGLDLFLGRYVFVEAEVRHRLLPGAGGDGWWRSSNLTGLLSVGVAFL